MLLNKYKSTVSFRGFTLIELIIVIGILSVLAAVLFSVINPFAQFQKANDGRRKSDLSQIQKALEQYYQDSGKYPSSSDNYRIIGLDFNLVDWGQSWQPYMNVLPKDPSSLKTYVYYSPNEANGQSYYLYASLDRGGNDPQTCYPNGAKCLNAPTSGCGGTCNYGVTSPNVSP